MRAARIGVALAAVALAAVALACPHRDAPAPVAPKGPSPCGRAADSLVQVMLDRLSHKDAIPTEEADAFRNLIRERCEDDQWSAEATHCLIAMRTVDDAAGCAPLMTEAQQAALVRDEDALLGNTAKDNDKTGEAPALGPRGSGED